MLYFCDKCQDYTEHKIKSITLKSGDDGFTHSHSYICSKCNFTPLFINPDKVKKEESPK